jgi:hypothetical protein
MKLVRPIKKFLNETYSKIRIGEHFIMHHARITYQQEY